MGENFHMSGEAASRTNIKIPGVQTELIKSLRKEFPSKQIIFNFNERASFRFI